MEQKNPIKIPKKKRKQYICENCNYKCGNKKDFNKHLLTLKHRKKAEELNGNDFVLKNPQKYHCKCGKQYKVKSGLWKHKKKCTHIETTANFDNNKRVDNSVLELISQNKELMNLLVVQNQEHKKETQQLKDTIQEMIPKIGNNNTTNNNNNQFNLNVFLNEDCKDAINFSEFIDNIKISFEDLENQAKIGYVNGVSKLFIENLRVLGTHKRPIHCTDKKRKTLYIKENNEWDKEGSQNTLKKGIREVSRKNLECLIQEKEKNSEEYNNIESEFSEKCIHIQRNILPSVPRDTSIGKVIEKITTETGVK